MRVFGEEGFRMRHRAKVKDDLQSLLMHHCGEDLRVETDPAHPELIGLTRIFHSCLSRESGDCV